METGEKSDPLIDSDEDDDAPGTAGGMAALFQKSNSLFSMSSSDYKKADMESKKFLKSGKNDGSKKPKKKSKKVDSVPKASSKSNRMKNKEIDLLYDDPELDLEVNQALGLDDGLLAEYRYGRKTNQNDDVSNEETQKTEDEPMLMEVDLTREINKSPINIIDEDEEVTDLDDSQSELGQMVPFYVSLNGETFSLMFYEGQYIDEVRKKVASRSGNPDPEFLQMFLENTLLEDINTVKESGIKNCSTIDVFVKYKSEQELFEEGSTAIIKLKLQTSDRRGRQNCFIYVKRTARMREVRDKYANLIGVNPADMKLESDGDLCGLDSTPEDCDLENDFVIDVTIFGTDAE